MTGLNAVQSDVGPCAMAFIAFEEQVGRTPMSAAAAVTGADKVLVARQFECDLAVAVGLEESPYSGNRVVTAGTPEGRVFIPGTPVRAVQGVLLADDSNGSRWFRDHFSPCAGTQSAPVSVPFRLSQVSREICRRCR